MNPDQILQRLAAQRIAGPKLERPEEVVRWMVCLQAQEYNQATWAVGLRVKSPDLSGVEQAIADRKIIRTWPMRGTLHFVPPEDAGWITRLSAARLLAGACGRQEQLGLDAAILARSQELFQDALRGGKILARPEMMDQLEQAGISTEKQRGYHLLWAAAQAGLICMGPRRGKQQTFVLLEEWVPHPRVLSRPEALAELARRYFASRGPATLADFAWWAGLGLGDARSGLAEVSSELVSTKVDGLEYWSKDDPGVIPATYPDADCLLPGFDEYLLGYTDRSGVLAREYLPEIIPGGGGIFRPVLVIQGQVSGTWASRTRKNSVEINLRPFAPLPAAQEQIRKAAQRYSDFLGLPLAGINL